MPLKVIPQPTGLPQVLPVAQRPQGVSTTLGVTPAPQQQLSPTMQAPAQQPQFQGVQIPQQGTVTPNPANQSLYQQPQQQQPEPGKLDDQHRQELDGIVMQMAQKNAPKEQVQMIVDDYVSKYGQQPKQTPPQDPSELNGALGFSQGVSKGVGSTVTNLTNMVQSGMTQTLGRVSNLLSGKGFTAPQQSPEDQALQAAIKKTVTPTNTAQTVGKTAEQVGEFFVPGGATADVTKAAETGIEGLKLGKFATGALKLGTKTAIGAGEAAGITGAQTGGDVHAMKTAALIGGIFPSAEAIVQAAASKFAPRLVNSLIKPLSKDFEFGKNAGQSITKEGITGTNWDSLISNIKATKNTVGDSIGQVLKTPEVAAQSVNLADALKPIDDAIAKATNQGDQAMISRLLEFRDGLTKQYQLVDGKLVEAGAKSLVIAPEDALKIKGDIGDSVRWREGIDNEVNKVKVKVYQNVRGQIENAVDNARKVNPNIPDIKQLNNRYANLTTAESAAQYRRNVVERLNLTSLAQKGTAIYGLGSAAKDLVTGHLQNLPTDLLIGIGGPLAEKTLGSVAGKTYGAKLVQNAPKVLRGVRNTTLGVSNQR